MSTRTYLCVLFSIDIHHRYVAIMGTRNKIWLKRARHEWKYLTCGVEGAEREISLRKLGDESGALSSQSITIYSGYSGN
jgi:hypothetical protein